MEWTDDVACCVQMTFEDRRRAAESPIASLPSYDSALEAEERALLEQAAELESAVKMLKVKKEERRATQQREEAQKRAEAENNVWKEELRAEVESAISRLNAQRAEQLVRCNDFDAKLRSNV